MATTKEAAEYLKLSPARVKQLIKQGKLPATRRHGRRGTEGKGVLEIDDAVLERFAKEYKPKPGRPRKTVDEWLKERGL